MNKGYSARAERAETELHRATEAGEPFVVVTSHHLIASGNPEWFRRILALANEGIEETAKAPAADTSLC